MTDSLVWVVTKDRIVQLDPANGEMLADLRYADELPVPYAAVSGFGSLWMYTSHPGLVRVDQDLTWTLIDLPPYPPGDCELACFGFPVIGTAAVMVPLADLGIAFVDPTTIEVTVITADQVGHRVDFVAVGPDDVVFVASEDRVTSLLNGVPHATTPTRVLRYLGWVDGVFGALETTGWFNVLGAGDPMIVESIETNFAGIGGVSGWGNQAWEATGPHHGRRLVLPPDE